ncbi:MAG: S9 family peptidase, partial [Gammaproteobacteria bacterium]|nr:S9 family peptidase [Gammaproteobacteria bacterium]
EQLSFIDTNSMRVTAHYHVEGEQMIYQLWWVNDTRVVFTTATQTGSFDQPSLTGDIWAINVNGGNLQTLAYHVGKGVALQYHFNSVVYASTNSPHEILISDQIVSSGADPVIYRVNVDTAKRHQVLVSPMEYGSVYADNAGHVRLAFGTNMKTFKWVLKYRKPGSVEWKDLSSLVDSEPNYTAIGPVQFTVDENKFYYEGYGPDGTMGLYLIDPNTMKKTLLYEDPHYDIDNTFSDTTWLTGPDQKTLIGFEYWGDMPEWILLHPKAPEAKLLASLESSFSGQNVNITSIDASGQHAVVFVSSDRNPGDYYLYDGQKHSVRYLFSVLPGIDPKAMAAMQPISFKARDGLTIHGYLTLPIGEHKPLPLVVNPHGGPFGIRDHWQFDPETEFLAYHGYAVLQVNYRGSGGYGATFQNAGFYQWGGTMQDDLADATEWAINQGIADPKRICIYGGSYGGYAALEAVVKTPELYKCAVGYAGVYDLVMLHDRGGEMYYSSHGMGAYLSNTLGDNLAALRAASPVDHVNRIKAALFLAHGGADETVPIGQANEMRSALDKAGKKYEWLYYPNEGHGYFKLAHRVVFYDKMLAFLNQNIGH